MSEAKDIEHAIRQVVEELIVPKIYNLKAGLRSLRGDLEVGFNALEVRTDSHGRARRAAIDHR